MKFFLILWVCSAIHGSCITPPITVPGSYNSHTECVSAGYKEGHNVFPKANASKRPIIIQLETIRPINTGV